MRNQSTSSLHFQCKISEFCNIRIAPVVTKRALEKIRSYLTSLVIYRQAPPMRNGRIDWQAIAGACGIEDEMTAELKKNLRPGLDAIIRWLDKERPAEDDRPAVEQPRRKRNPTGGSAKVMAAGLSSSAAPAPIEREQTRAKPGIQPRPVEEFPMPLFDWTEEPEGFQQALIYHMRRHGDSYWHLHRAGSATLSASRRFLTAGLVHCVGQRMHWIGGMTSARRSRIPICSPEWSTPLPGSPWKWPISSASRRRR